jgi:IS1 family transposase
MNRLAIEKRAQILGMFSEGMSLRSTSRLADVSINTVSKLLVDVGAACMEYQDKTFHDLQCKRIQVDEIWSFCRAKAKNVPEEHRNEFGWGDVWTWVAIDADTKLVPSWLIGNRSAVCASEFIADLKARLANRVQLTSDGHRPYLQAVEAAFGDDVDYAMLQKIYGPASEQHRYSPPQCVGIRRDMVQGNPDPDHVSTSYVERQNLTMRMSMRRLTRLTNGFSKKIENHMAATAIYFMHYNFARIHKSLRVTPAMAAGVSDHVWSLEEIVGLIARRETQWLWTSSIA